MEFDNATEQGHLAESYALEELLTDHQVAVFCVCLCSLILGTPLAWNVLWHLKERFSNCKCNIINVDDPSLTLKQVQGISIGPFPGLVNFVPAVAYFFCLNLPAAFS